MLQQCCHLLQLLVAYGLNGSIRQRERMLSLGRSLDGPKIQAHLPIQSWWPLEGGQVSLSPPERKRADCQLITDPELVMSKGVIWDPLVGNVSWFQNTWK
ncbi:hypothetical protein XENOCAPTIV_023497 [Xenoophorus captivus]|uniref:Uncharacterized protein n=1 Tax=Xenoophorus captivus TaxID=1517983 RepID=A0ABV0S2Z6_9TELE